MLDTFKLIENQLLESDSGAYASHHGMLLRSAFQPIFSLCHRRVVGYEGLLRVASQEGQIIEPLIVFASARGEPDVVHLDRLSRALHMHNFSLQDQSQAWLFLNINPKVIVQGRYYGSFFGDLLSHYQMKASRVVVEIIEGEIEDESQLSESVDFYKNLGCLVAIDDFGAGHSNFERVWRLSPDIVKLDRTMITQAVQSPIARRVLPGIVSLIHEAGSLVLIEGIETEQEAMIAMDTDVDLVQGNYFASPDAKLKHSMDSQEISALFRQFSQKIPQEFICKKVSKYADMIAEAAEKIQVGFAMSHAVEPIMKMPGVDRCYLLNQMGVQVGSSVVAEREIQLHDDRFAPLADGRDANWFRRAYLQNALQYPKQLQVTRPYLSIATGRLCITFSISLMVMGQLQVFCCDLDWNDD